MPRLLAIAATIALGLSAGAVLTEGAVLVPWWRSMPPQAFLDWYASHTRLLFAFFGTLESVAALLAITTAVVHRSGPFAVAALLSVAVLAFFPLYFRDVNASFAAGTIGVAQVAEELGRWAVWHWCRTAIAIGAFASAVAGARR